jgi:thymidine kinase
MCCHGKIKFNYGAMGSGKSLHLIATAHNFKIHSIPFIVLKSKIDDRDGDDVIHSRAIGDIECVGISTDDNLYEMISKYLNADLFYGAKGLKWILIDECQFLTEKQVDELGAIADNLGINVLCYGLRTDFRTQLFPGSKRLFEIADSFEEIKSSCYCNSKTIFNARINKDGEIVTDGEQIEVGGDDRYVSLCRRCYFEKTHNPLYEKNDL